MLAQGWDEERALAQLAWLTSAIPPDPRATLLAEGFAEEPAPAPELEEAEAAEAPDPLDQLSLEELPLADEIAAQQAAAEAELLSGFVIAKTKRKVKRFHFVGNCGKVPGEHYADFDVWGDILPPADAFDVVCEVCFRGDKGEVLTRPLGPEDLAEADRVGTSSSSSSSSSSSADGEGAGHAIARAKRPRAGASTP